MAKPINELSLNRFSKLAELAKLNIPKDKQPKLLEKMERIISFVDQMDGTDFTGIKPLLHPLEQIQPLREDIKNDNIQRNKFQALAPSTTENLYLVPQVIDNGE